MKKFIAIILMTAICLTLSSCGKAKVEDVKSEEDVKVEEPIKVEEAIIGDWTYDLIWKGITSSDRDNPDMCLAEGHSATNTLSFFRGGTVTLKSRSNETGFETTQFNGTWEVVDGVVVMSATILWESASYSIEVDTESEPYTLRLMNNPDVVYTKTT